MGKQKEYGDVKALFGIIQEKIPDHAKMISEAMDLLDEHSAKLLQRYIDVCHESSVALDDMAASYLLFVNDTNEEQRHFYETGNYRYKMLAEVVDKVYRNAAYMQQYMVGLAVSTFIWPQHRKYYAFFKQFIASMAYVEDKCGTSYLEVGAGHGLYVSEVVRQDLFARYDILDISETSLAMTQKMTAEFVDKRDIRFIHADFLEFENEDRYDVISISEVLEHVETPQAFMDKSRKLLKDNGRLYLTTCINAPEIDHIFLFGAIQEVEKLFESAGLGIEEKLYVPYRNTTVERSERQKLPINVAYVLKRI